MKLDGTALLQDLQRARTTPDPGSTVRATFVRLALDRLHATSMESKGAKKLKKKVQEWYDNHKPNPPEIAATAVNSASRAAGTVPRPSYLAAITEPESEPEPDFDELLLSPSEIQSLPEAEEYDRLTTEAKRQFGIENAQRELDGKRPLHPRKLRARYRDIERGMRRRKLERIARGEEEPEEYIRPEEL